MNIQSLNTYVSPPSWQKRHPSSIQGIAMHHPITRDEDIRLVEALNTTSAVAIVTFNNVITS